MNHPGVWILGDLDNDDPATAWALSSSTPAAPAKPNGSRHRPSKWNYSRFAKPGATAASPDVTFEMTFAKDNAAEEGFNRWTINGVAFPMDQRNDPRLFSFAAGQALPHSNAQCQ